MKEVMTAYYNENNPCAAQWLRNLIDAGMIAPGVVDDRSITDVRAEDLNGFTQCHFFAGIGGWSFALRIAGWPDDRSVWTGSAPCQPYSVAGKQKGAEDHRDLWPHMFDLIAQRRPPIIFGEQVSNAIRLGWLDRVSSDLEAANYSVGSIVLGAHSVGAPHIRQRLCWGAVGLEDSNNSGLEGQPGSVDIIYESRRKPSGQNRGPVAASGVPVAERVVYPNSIRCDGDHHGSEIKVDTAKHPWFDFELVRFPDGATRRTQPGVYPVDYGLPARMGRDCTGAKGEAKPNRRAIIEGFGNAIVPELAAEFVTAFLSVTTKEKK
jgi:DNA (cytosine-5)-methyltransferase 1